MSVQAIPGLRVLIVDNDPLVQHGAAILLRSRPGWSIQVISQDQLVLQTSQVYTPDVALVGLHHLRDNDITCIHQLKEQGIRVLAYSASATTNHLRGVIAAGADGLVSRSESADNLVTAIEACATGRQMVWIGDEAHRLLEEMHLVKRPRGNAKSKLTNRELEVLNCLAEGMTNTQISQHLNISVGTVKAHVGHLLRKYGLSSRTQLAIIRTNPEGI